MSFERRIFYYLENLKRQLRTQPLILGGVTASGGGLGAPPGGFIGVLPQTRVAFDLTEAVASGIPASGPSLLDNLNRIRYDIANLSGGGSSTFTGLTDTPGNYTGDSGKVVTVKNTEDGLEFSTASFSGNQIVYDYKQEDVTSQIPDGSDNFDLTETPISGYVTVHYNGVTQQPNNYTILASGIHTKFSPVAGDELFVEYRYTVSGGTSFIDVQKDDVTVVSGILTLNFEGGVTVTDEGSKKVTVTISGGVGGADTDAIHVDVANEITGITVKTTPVDADEFVIEDSAAAYVKKAVTFGNLESALDHDQLTNFAADEHRVWENSIAQDVHADNITQGSITQHQAALSITESQISDLGHVVEIQKDGATVVSAASTINFSGSGVSVTSGVGIANVTISGGGGGASTFLDLTDTPSSYTGHDGESVVVSGSSLIFSTVSGGGSATADYTYWSPDAPPTSPDTDDDEFEGSASGDTGTPSGWTLFDPDAEMDYTTMYDHGLTFSASSATDVVGYYKSCGSVGNGEKLQIYTKVAVHGTWDNSSTNSMEAGVAFWEDASGSTDEIVTAGIRLKQDTGVGLRLASMTDYDTLGTQDLLLELDPPVFTECYIMLEFQNIGGFIFGYNMYYSTGGGWIYIDYSTASFVPTHYGIYCIGATNSNNFSFFRVKGPGSSPSTKAIFGDRVNGYKA